MSAGHSADTEAQRQLALAEAHERAAIAARATAANYGIAAVTEKQTARTLSPLSAAGFHLLADRGWPGSRRAQVDLVVIGSGGVFIVDTKAWADVAIADDRIFRGQEDVTDDVMNLADLAYKTEGDFAEIGLAPGEVHPIILLAGRKGVNARVGPVAVLGEGDVLRYIASRGTRLTESQINLVLGRALAFFPVLGAPAPANATVPEPVLVEPRPASATEPHQGELLTVPEIESALLSRLMAVPVEEWMAFLHPNQAKVVRRSFNGPARIRGAAGTGKTVVGLHRAAYLARNRPGKVLVTTYVRTLPDVLGELLRRLAPDVVDRVEFCGVHGFARRVLDERGIDVRVNGKRATDAWKKAWDQAGRGSLLDTDRVPQQYWRDEVQHVIKARGITQFDRYADLARTGRRHRLTIDQRRAVWHLYSTYSQNLVATGTHDFDDVILLAAAELERDPMPEFTAVVVDEAQDLSAAAVRMLYSLVGDSPDGLTLIGDGQQSIYPGGYTLAEMGISVAGRGVVMDVNYRNTREVLEFAERMVVGDQFTDIETGIAAGPVLRPGDVAGNVTRSGASPVVEYFARWSDRTVAVVQRVREVTRDVGTGYGDVAVLCVSKRGAELAEEALKRAGIPTIGLLDYRGESIDAVKVGTIKRAKGLEFKQVVLADVRAEWLADLGPAGTASTNHSMVSNAIIGSAPSTDTVSAATEEQQTLLRRELYVAMTRARDGLWVGVV